MKLKHKTNLRVNIGELNYTFYRAYQLWQAR